MEKAVIDRIVDGEFAVILVGEDEREYHLPADRLPAEAGEGTWLRVSLQGGELVSIEVDLEETDIARRRLQEKISRLRARGRGPGRG